MLRPHGRGSHHIASEDGSVPDSPEDHRRSAPPASDAAGGGAVSPNRSDGPVLSMSSLPGAEIVPRPATAQSRLSVGVLSRDTCKFEKATEGGAHAAKSRIGPRLSAN